MKRVVQPETNARAWPDPWQMVVIGLCALILCSCRSPAAGPAPLVQSQPGDLSLPAVAHTGAPAVAAPAACMGPPGMEAGVPLPYTPCGPWSPPGIRQPWPADEYIRDGGDEGLPTDVGRQREVLGLEMEDAVACFDTLDGRTVVEPSNEVFLYSPRFGAVRQVVGLMANEERQHAGGVHVPEKLDTPTTLQLAAGVKQNVQPNDEIAARPPVAIRTEQKKDILSTAIGPRGFQSSYQAYENLAIVRQGIVEMAEMPMLARGSNAAIAWSHTQAVQILLEPRGAMAEVKYDASMSVYTAVSPPGCPKLRLVKVASTPFAKPGDTVDFTLRFDNIGNQPLNNVTILDSLSTRLEYVPGSAQCSVEAKFCTQPNEGGSEVVHCGLSAPLDPGHGGVLRFRCRVR
jgi:uncharacterized repeat protein (TIGR01451 family)